MKDSKQKIRGRSLKVNAIVNIIKTILSLAFPLITFPYVSRVLGVNQLGKYNFANSIVSYFLLIAALGISTYAVREGTQYREDKDKIDEFASEMFSINIISTIFSYILLGICLLLVRRFDACRTEILIFSIEIIATTLGVEWIYNIYEDFVFIAIRSFIFQCISLLLLFVFVHGPQDLDKYVLITVISLTGNNIFNWFHSKRYCNIKLTRNIDWKRHLKPILTIFSSSIAVTIYVNSDTTMLGFLIDDSNYTVGIYSVATKIYNIFKNVIVAFMIVLIPRFSLLTHEKNGKEKVTRLFNQLSTVLLTVATPMIIGMIILAQDIVIIVSGKEYLPAVPSFRILMMACLFSFFAYLFAQCILIPNKREKDFLLATAISSIVNIGLNFFLIPFLHEIGAALTTLLAELITMVIVFNKSKDFINFKIKKSDIISVVLGVILIYFLCTVIRQYITQMILRDVFCILFSIVIYWIVLKLCHNSVIEYIDEKLAQKINGRNDASFDN